MIGTAAIRCSITAWLIAFLLLASVAGGAAELPLADYRLNAGDRIDVSVWKEKELQREITISPDGKFAFPLVGEIAAAGKNVAQVRMEIESRLKKYIPEPVVTVLVLQVNGNTAYIIGQVNKPGALVMNPAVTILQALSLAGGATPFAKLDSIIVLRKTSAGEQVLRFRYGQVAEGKDLQQNVQLEAGDVVIVP